MRFVGWKNKSRIVILGQKLALAAKKSYIEDWKKERIEILARFNHLESEYETGETDDDEVLDESTIKG